MKEYTLSLDYYELLNLHKALLEAKFNSDPDNELGIWESFGRRCIYSG